MGGQPTQGMQVQSTSSQNKSEPHPYIQGDLLKQIEQLRAWQEKNPTAPGYFPGGTVAPQSAGTISANTTAFQRGAGGLGYGLNDAAKRAALDTISGKHLDPNLNTAYQGWLDASFRPQAEHFRDIIAPSIDSKFAGAGRTAGGAHVDTTMRGYKDLAQTQSDAAAKAGLGLYQGERDKQFQAMGLLPQFQAMDWQDIMGMQGAAAANDAYAQRLRDDAVARYSYEATAQPDFLTGMAQRYLGMFPGGQTLGSGTTQGWSTSGGGGGGAGQFIGPAVSIAGTALAMY